MNKILKRNCICYQVYTYSQKCTLLFYIVTLYYMALGLSYTNIAILSVIGTISTLLSEIPTGIIADRWSRKKSLQIASFLKLLSAVLMLMGTRVSFLCIASLIWGIADSCQSGAEQALLFETFEDKKKYEEFLSKTYSRAYLMSAIATISATALFAVNIYVPVMISVVLIAVSLVAVSNFVEVRKEAPKTERTLFDFNKDVILCIKHTSGLLNVLLLMSFCTVLVMSVNSYSQPLLMEKGVDLKILGLMMFAYNLLMALGAQVSSRMKVQNLHYILGLILCIGAVIVGCSNVWICVLVLGIYRIANGMIWPVLTCKINNLVSSEFRSTVMSYQNMFTSILCIVADPIVGISLDWVGIERFYLVFGCVFSILILGLFLKELRIKKKYSSQNQKNSVKWYSLYEKR